MPSKKPSKTHKQEIQLSPLKPYRDRFLELNQQSFAEVLTFLDFAEGFTLGFLEINFKPDLDILIETLIADPRCQEMQLQILDFGDRKIRFLLDELQIKLSAIKINSSKKLILILRGLEKSIGMFGDYPSILQDLNFVRDAFPRRIPHPILFCLPDYTITRLAKFAPDFWVWKSGGFRFKTAQATRDDAWERVLDERRFIKNIEPAETQERIDLLHRLLMEYMPTGETVSQENRKICVGILIQLGRAYRSRAEGTKAKEYLEKAFDLTNADDDFKSSKATVLRELGIIKADRGQIEEAIADYQQSLELFERIGDVQGKAATLHQLAIIKANQGEIEEAIALYTQSMELFERIGNLQGKAATLGMLGQLLAIRGDFTTALQYMHESLEILERLRSPEAETVRRIIVQIQQMAEE